MTGAMREKRTGGQLVSGWIIKIPLSLFVSFSLHCICFEHVKGLVFKQVKGLVS